MTTSAPHRLAHIDWMRGLACVLMFQTHCYDSWLNAEARGSTLFHWSQLAGTFPAPLFLFLAGVSFAMITVKLWQKGVAADEIARTTILRGAQIFGLGLLFRVQEFVLGYQWAPWTDLLRVDILNTIGLSMMLMGVVCRLAQGQPRGFFAAAGAALGIALLTPPLWTTWRGVTSSLPWWLETYVNGVHHLNEPQPWLFPAFPWAAFAFAGLALGLAFDPGAARRDEDRAHIAVGIFGAVLAGGAWMADAKGPPLYAVYDFWHTSPNFFLIRLGLVLVLFFLCYAWCRWGWGSAGFSPILQLGTTSLLVYWVHIQFVYGRFSILPKKGAGAGLATAGLASIFVMMLALSVAWTKYKKRKKSRRAGNE